MRRFNIPLLIVGIIIITVNLGFIITGGYDSVFHQDNRTLLNGLARDYYQNHEYTLEGDYVCFDMALDFWDVVIAHDMNAKIVIGNRTQMPDTIKDANHAWVIVEVEPDTWVPVEVVNGSVMYGVSNYYHGWVFDTPKETKDFLNKYDETVALFDLFIRVRSEYNEKVKVYDSLLASGANGHNLEGVREDIQELYLITDYVGNAFNQSQTELDGFEAGLPKILGIASL